MEFIENYKTKMIFKKFGEITKMIDEIKRKEIKRGILELELYELWKNHDCAMRMKGFCDLCEKVDEQGLYHHFLDMGREEVFVKQC